jgi:twitching motility protein PilU
MEFLDYLKYLVENEGSDLYLTTSAAPSVKIQGVLKAIPSQPPFKAGEVRAIAYAIMNADQTYEFQQTHEMNLALSYEDLGRFRVNIFRQRNEIGIVVRYIKMRIPSLSDLGLPAILKKLIMEKRGLILFVGATGSGKSTSLASLIGYRNLKSAGHIITVEDPIEFVHDNKMSIITQREVGVDTLSYGDALRNTLRQAPDVILIGEIRSQETMEHAITFAETGHLCLSTLHANNANQAMDRIINFFPEERHKQLFLDLSLNLRGMISQRLVPGVEGKRVAAVEILLGSPLIQDLIHKGDITGIKEVMERSENIGMQTFDSALFQLFKAGKISLSEAIKNADSKNNLRLKIQLDKGVNADEEGSSLAIQKDDDETGGDNSGGRLLKR